MLGGPKAKLPQARTKTAKRNAIIGAIATPTSKADIRVATASNFRSIEDKLYKQQGGKKKGNKVPTAQLEVRGHGSENWKKHVAKGAGRGKVAYEVLGETEA